MRLGISEEVRLVSVDYLQIDSLARVIDLTQPDEVYNLAAQSSVARSFEAPTETGEVTGTRRGALASCGAARAFASAFLSGVEFGNVRSRARNAAKRGHAVLSAQSLWRRQGLRALHDD